MEVEEKNALIKAKTLEWIGTLTPEQILVLVENRKSLEAQRDEILSDVKAILLAISEIGEKFSDKSKLQKLLLSIPKAMVTGANPLAGMTEPFEAFATKYGPICFPEAYGQHPQTLQQEIEISESELEDLTRHTNGQTQQEWEDSTYAPLQDNNTTHDSDGK